MDDAGRLVVFVLLRDAGGEGGRLQLLVALHPDDAGLLLLHLVHVDDVLVGGARLRERIQLVHVADVLPQVGQLLRDLVVQEELARHPERSKEEEGRRWRNVVSSCVQITG